MKSPQENNIFTDSSTKLGREMDTVANPLQFGPQNSSPRAGRDEQRATITWLSVRFGSRLRHSSLHSS
jgi:hypothetical protein